MTVERLVRMHWFDQEFDSGDVEQEAVIADFLAHLARLVDCVEYVDGPVTMVGLYVVGACSSASGVPNPVPSTPIVVDERGEPIGELLLCLYAQGYINSLEYASFTDETPTVLPPIDRARHR